MSRAKEIKALIEEMDNTRRSLAAELNRIDADNLHSDSYKLAARGKAIEEARARLRETAMNADAALPDWEQFAARQTAFCYDDPKLLAAVQFIKANGSALPQNAWKAMIADFHNKPAVLFYLANMMDSNGVIDGAIEAKETAQQIAFSSNLPQRISDSIYYAAEADPMAHVDLSGIMRELDGLEAFEAATETNTKTNTDNLETNTIY